MGIQRDHYTVFYSWSNDNDQRVCRSFIRTALDMACRNLTIELEEAERPIQVDQDTQGQGGSPAIMETIERKIRECDVFVADLTPAVVQKRPDGTARIIPNPNVMYELGYANRSIGTDRVITVLNTAFAGAARASDRRLRDNALPFNLRHRRFPICYEIEEEECRKLLKAERDQFVKSLVKRIGLIISDLPNSTEILHEPTQPAGDRPGSFFRDQQTILQEHPETKWREESAQIYIRFIPEQASDLSIYELKKICVDELLENPPLSNNSGHHGPNKHGLINCSIKPLPDDMVISRDLIQFFSTGEVWAIFQSVLKRSERSVPWTIEDIVAWSIAKIATFVERSGFAGRGKVIVGISGIEGWRFIPALIGDSGPAPSNQYVFHNGEFRFEREVNQVERSSLGRIAVAAANRIWAEAGLERPAALSANAMDSDNSGRKAYWHLF